MIPSKQDTSEHVLSSHSQRMQTIIAQGIKVEGSFRGQGQVVIEGEVKGDVIIEGSLTVGSQATIEANIQAQDAVLSGLIRGNVTVKGRLECTSTARIKGDIRCDKFVVQEGAVLAGAIRVGSEEL